MEKNKKVISVRQVFAAYDFRGSHNIIETYKFCPKCGSRNDLVNNCSYARCVCSCCGFTSYKNPVPGVSVLIENNGMVLLGRRAASSFAAGKWCLPCGFVEYDEDIRTAAIREVKEETGLTIELRSIIQVTSNFLSADLHSVVIVFLAKVKNGLARPGDDIDKLDWFQIKGELPPLGFDADREIIERFSVKPIEGLPVEDFVF